MHIYLSFSKQEHQVSTGEMKEVPNLKFKSFMLSIFFFNPEMYSGSLTALKSKNIKHEGSMSGAMENSSVGFLLLVLERV